jgi:pimeloyl-ACP methyl ester carboxylesterase
MHALAERMPGARLQVLDGTGHICNHEVPQLLNRVLAGFLGEDDA